MPFQDLLSSFGAEPVDPEEESFLLFSQSIPSQDLGFVDSKATALEITVGDRDLTIHQSPTILSSTRGGGTTGAVVWKITPLFASWITAPGNFLFEHQVLSQESSVLELGSGISGIIALALGPFIKSYTLTDQEYVMKILNKNLDENRTKTKSSNKARKGTSKSKKSSAFQMREASSNIAAKALDWEIDEVASTLTGFGHDDGSFDAVIACDCIYNDALIDPLVQTCSDICRLRTKKSLESGAQPTLCIVAQQLRSAEVFEAWLLAFHKKFQVWRLPDSNISKDLGTDSGFVVHIGILREEAGKQLAMLEGVTENVTHFQVP